MLCFLNKLQDGLRRRDIYVPQSERWGDPREKLLDGFSITVSIGRMNIAFEDIAVHEAVYNIGAFALSSADHE